MYEPPEPTEQAVTALADQIATSLMARSDGSVITEEHQPFIRAFAYALLKVIVPTAMHQEFTRDELPWYGLPTGRITRNMFAIGLIRLPGEGLQLCIRARVLFGNNRGPWQFIGRGRQIAVTHGKAHGVRFTDDSFRRQLVAILRPVMNLLDYRS